MHIEHAYNKTQRSCWRDHLPRVFPDGDPDPHVLRQEDPQVVPQAPPRHLPLRGEQAVVGLSAGVLWGECTSHGLCGRGCLIGQMAPRYWFRHSQVSLGIYTTRRCYGNFFCCDDQKAHRTDSKTLDLHNEKSNNYFVFGLSNVHFVHCADVPCHMLHNTLHNVHKTDKAIC